MWPGLSRGVCPSSGVPDDIFTVTRFTHWAKVLFVLWRRLSCFGLLNPSAMNGHFPPVLLQGSGPNTVMYPWTSVSSLQSRTHPVADFVTTSTSPETAPWEFVHLAHPACAACFSARHFVNQLDWIPKGAQAAHCSFCTLDKTPLSRWKGYKDSAIFTTCCGKHRWTSKL